VPATRYERGITGAAAWGGETGL